MTDAVRLARWYAWALGAGLFLEGAVLLVLTPNGDVRHNAIHVAWGAVILLILWRNPSIAPRVLVVFGVFYVFLGFAGVLSRNPFGLLLGLGENAFHLMVGPLALVLGLLSLMAPRSAAHAERR